jgi:hypothetical protein
MNPASPVGPGDVHAVLVGIEHYPGLGARWSLPGAVEDAHRLADWLIRNGVPSDNVCLFTSPDPERPPTRSAPVPPRTADRGTIDDTIRNGLSLRAGGLLLFYWAGHGLIDAKDRLCLPYANATLNDPSGLILEDALAWLGSEAFPSGRFERQVVFVDACRLSPKPSRRPFDVTDMSYPPRVRRPSTDQNVLYACRLGESTENKPRSDNPKGLFSEVLMEELARRGIEDLHTSVDAVAEAVQAKFAELRADKKASQTPVQMYIQGWDKNRTWIETQLGSTRHAHGIDDKAWEDLAPILRGAAPAEWCRQAFHWSFGYGENAEQVPYTMPEGDLLDWARELDEYEARPDGLPKVVMFVHALAAGYQAGEDTAAIKRGEKLNSWIGKVRHRHCLPELPDAPRPQTADATLMVCLDQDPRHEDFLYLDVWLRSSGWHRLEPEDGGERGRVTLDQARDVLDQRMAGLNQASAGKQKPYGLRRVEFAVGQNLLEADFDQWEMKAGYLRRFKLGRRFEVVVRCPDVRRPTNLAYLWSCRWRWLTQNSGCHPSATVWVSHPDLDDVDGLEDLIDAWSTEHHPVCVAVDAAAPHSVDGWQAALDAGMPVVVWQRPGSEPDGRDGDEGTPPSLREILTFEDVADLPSTVRKLRIGKGVDRRISSTVVLLWDDPNHVLDRAALSDTGLRPPSPDTSLREQDTGIGVSR